METKQFPTTHVLSIVTGRLMGDIGGVYEVLNWMTGESLFTHQLPRVSYEAKPVIIAAIPALQRAVDEADEVTTENWEKWRDAWLARYGATLAVPKLNVEQHERIDPLSEAAEMIHPDKIIPVAI